MNRAPIALVVILATLSPALSRAAEDGTSRGSKSADRKAAPDDFRPAPDFVDGEDAAESLPGYLEHYTRPFLADTREIVFTHKYYWHRLFRPTPADRKLGGAVIAVAIGLWSHKEQIQADWAQRDTTIEHETTLKRIQKLGGGGIIPATALFMYLGGSAFRDYRTKQTGVMIAHSLLLTDMVTLVGRWALAEDRPKYGGALHPFQGFGGGISGHSATAASISGVLSRMYLQREPDDSRAVAVWKRIGKGFVYGLPVIVAFGRVNDQQHYLYNTVLGLSIGYWSGNVVADAHGFYVHGTPSRLRPSSVGPIMNDRGAPGVGARWDF